MVRKLYCCTIRLEAVIIIDSVLKLKHPCLNISNQMFQTETQTLGSNILTNLENPETMHTITDL